MKKVTQMLAVLLMLSAPVLAQKATKTTTDNTPAKPLTAKQRKAVIAQLRKDGKLRRMRIRKKGDATPLQPDEDELKIVPVAAANVTPIEAPQVQIPDPVTLATQIVTANMDQITAIAAEAVKTPEGITSLVISLTQPEMSSVDVSKLQPIAAALEQLSPDQVQKIATGLTPVQVASVLVALPNVPGVVVERVAALLAAVPAPVLEQVAVTLTPVQVSSLLAALPGLPKVVISDVSNIVAAIPPEVLSPALVAATPDVVRLVLNTIPEQKAVDVLQKLSPVQVKVMIVSLAGSLDNTLMRNNIELGAWDKVASGLQQAGISSSVVTAFIERLKSI